MAYNYPSYPTGYPYRDRFHKPRDPEEAEERKNKFASESRDNARDLMSPKRAKAHEILKVLRRAGSARALLDVARQLGEPLDLDIHVTERRKKEVLEWYEEKLKFLVYERLSIGYASDAEELIEFLGQGIDFTDTAKEAYKDCIRLKMDGCADKIKEVFPNISFD